MSRIHLREFMDVLIPEMDITYTVTISKDNVHQISIEQYINGDWSQSEIEYQWNMFIQSFSRFGVYEIRYMKITMNNNDDIHIHIEI